MDLKNYKIVGGAMSWISDPTLVAAMANAGALGVLATGAMDGPMLDLALKEIKQKTDRDFAVNLIGISPHYNELLKVCSDHKIKAIIIAATIPRRDKISQVKAIGAKVLAFATSLKIAQDLIKNGIDAIILEGNEAGGHVGMISTSILIQDILFNLPDFPIFVAGGIGTPEMVKHCIAMGATGCQLGTRFVCSKESPMHEKTKQFYISQQARDTVVVGALNPIFSVIPVRVIKNKAVDDFYDRQRQAIKLLENEEISLLDAQMMIEHFWSGSLKRGVIEGDLEYGSLMAGQSISFVKGEEAVREIIDSMVSLI